MSSAGASRAARRLVDAVHGDGAGRTRTGAPDRIVLIAVTREGAPRVATGGRDPAARPGDTVIVLEQATTPGT